MGKAQKDDIFEPYNYPHLRETVSAVLTDGVQARINVRGEVNKRPGRKFNYSEEDFLESYLGRDYTAKINLKDDEYNQTFGFQETLKELFPDKSPYLKLPKLLDEQRRLDEYIGYKTVDGETADPHLGPAIESLDQDQYVRDLMEEANLEHPEQPGRTLLGDLEDELAKFDQQVVEQGRDQWHRNEIGKIYNSVVSQYTDRRLGTKKG